MLRTLAIVLTCFAAVFHATQASATEAKPTAEAAPAAKAEPATEAARPCDSPTGPLGPPSRGAQGMPGALGTCELKPGDWQEGKTTWWLDSDGVKPGVAGCHVGTNDRRQPNNRKFGEGCLFNNTLLIESNPDAGELHSHGNDLGHPDLFDCAQWCSGTGKGGGRCVAEPNPSPCTQSAWCRCDR